VIIVWKAKIKKIFAREILDSRGNPTVEVDVHTKCGIATAAVPSGASTGVHEALEMRDKDDRFHGKGVLKAIENVNFVIAQKVVGMDATKQRDIDKVMLGLDGTENKSRLGANAILGVSMAVCKAGAMCEGIPLYKYIQKFSGTTENVLPVPSFNVINGGEHAGNKLDIQEFMLMPIGAVNFRTALRMGSEIYHTLKSILKKKYGIDSINVGDEGGFAPPLKTVDEPLKLLVEAIKESGYDGKVKIAMDCAASSFYKDGKYILQGKKKTGDQLVEMYAKLVDKYPIISIEDPFDEEDFDSFAKLNAKIGSRIQIVGDDLLVTNPKRIQLAMDHHSCNSLLLKVNQIGSVTEAIDAASFARSHGWSIMVSHRSGETSDNFIADLVVGIKAGQIKSGAPCRGERLSKYNQLLRIEDSLGRGSRYAGENFRSP